MDSFGRVTRFRAPHRRIGLVAEKAMSSRAIWFWVLLAAGLLATILLLERHKRQQTLPPVAIFYRILKRAQLRWFR